MSEFKLNSPVVFIIFNRPQKTAQVFAEIAHAQPTQLFIVADGPRKHIATDIQNVIATRDIIRNIDWPCVVKTNFSDINLGCKQRITTGLDWVFSQVEEAIILEDDCVPHPTFFRYCDELLKHYRYNSSVAMISGDNHQDDHRRGDGSYYFSRYAHHIWGWATWKRAWQKYDVSMKSWPDFKNKKWLQKNAFDSSEYRYWTTFFNTAYAGKIDTWDIQWDFAVWSQNMLAIIPNVNLVKNIGFGSDATHTFEICAAANFTVQPMIFPIKHPNHVIQNIEADRYSANKIFQQPIFPIRLFRKIYRTLYAVINVS